MDLIWLLRIKAWQLLQIFAAVSLELNCRALKICDRSKI